METKVLANQLCEFPGAPHGDVCRTGPATVKLSMQPESASLLTTTTTTALFGIAASLILGCNSSSFTSCGPV